MALAALSLNAFADEPADKWSLVYGRWGQAPLYGHGLKVTDDYVYVYEYASEIFPEGEVICTLPYRKHEVYKAYTVFSTRSPVYDVFVLELSESCKWDIKGNVLIMAIPENHREHARISTLMKLDDLPPERPHTIRGPSYMPPKATWSSGYGIRCRLDECEKYESGD